MTLRKAVYGVCLMLMLAVQFLVAQHASVHPVELEHNSHSGVVQQDHDDHQGHNDGCGLCDFIKAVSYSVKGSVPVFACTMAVLFIAYNGMALNVRTQRLKTSSYHSQAPPVLLS